MAIRNLMKFALVAVIVLLGSGAAFCETNAKNAEALQMVSEKLGLPKSSKFFSNFSKKIDNTLTSEKKKKACIKAKQEFPEPTGSGKVIKHFTGNMGTAFNDGAPLPHPFMPALDYLEEHKEEVIQATMREFEQAKIDEATPKLPTCAESKTLKARTSADTPSKEEENEILFDMVFMDAKEVPADPSLYFGPSAVVMPYTAGELEPMWPLMQTSGVNCLPYRLRVTPKYTFAHTGQDALKNYNTNPNGRGQVSDKYKNWPLVE